MESFTKEKGKAFATRYFLNALEALEGRLRSLQAFELLGYLKGKVTEQQKERRERYRIKAKQDAILEMKDVDWLEQYKVKRELISKIRLN